MSKTHECCCVSAFFIVSVYDIAFWGIVCVSCHISFENEDSYWPLWCRERIFYLTSLARFACSASVINYKYASRPSLGMYWAFSFMYQRDKLNFKTKSLFPGEYYVKTLENGFSGCCQTFVSKRKMMEWKLLEFWKDISHLAKWWIDWKEQAKRHDTTVWKCNNGWYANFLEKLARTLQKFSPDTPPSLLQWKVSKHQDYQFGLLLVQVLR